MVERTRSAIRKIVRGRTWRQVRGCPSSVRKARRAPIPEKGFEFIGRDNGGEDAFCHKKDCEREDLEAGQRVSFVCTESTKGPSASKVLKEEGGTLIAEENEGAAGRRQRT